MKKLLSIIILIILLNSTTLYASETVDSTTTIPKGYSATVAAMVNASNKVAGATILSLDVNTYVLKFDNRVYSDLEIEVKKEFMETSLGSIKKSQMGTTQKNKLYNFIASQDESVSSAIRYLQSDTNADFLEARKWFTPFSGPISTILGFLCICIFAFLSLSVVFDIAYLVIPLFQLFVERGEDKKRPWGVSVEAWTVRKEVESSSTYKGTIQLYAKRRFPIFICIAFIICWLISGKIYDIVIFFVDSFNF